MRAAVLPLLLIALSIPDMAVGACFDWPLRERNGRPAYDGDTIYITMPSLPASLARMSVRMDGIDTAEAGHRARCPREKALGSAATQRLVDILETATEVLFCNPSWDKYGGRINAEVRADGVDVGALLIAEGHARPYDGGKRGSWCD